jgi:hypothetical protein
MNRKRYGRSGVWLRDEPKVLLVAMTILAFAGCSVPGGRKMGSTSSGSEPVGSSQTKAGYEHQVGVEHADGDTCFLELFESKDP